MATDKIYKSHSIRIGNVTSPIIPTDGDYAISSEGDFLLSSTNAVITSSGFVFNSPLIVNGKITLKHATDWYTHDGDRSSVALIGPQALQASTATEANITRRTLGLFVEVDENDADLFADLTPYLIDGANITAIYAFASSTDTGTGITIQLVNRDPTSSTWTYPSGASNTGVTTTGSISVIDVAAQATGLTGITVDKTKHWGMYVNTGVSVGETARIFGLGIDQEWTEIRRGG